MRTLYRIWTFSCDRPGCEESVDIGPGSTARQGEAAIMQSGWMVERSPLEPTRHLCPKHLTPGMRTAIHAQLHGLVGSR